MNHEFPIRAGLVDDSLQGNERWSVEGREATSHWGGPPNLIAPDCELITPEMLTLVELDQQQIETIVRTVPGGARNVQDIYALSPLQEGMLFHHLLNEQSDTYVLSTLVELKSHAQIGALINALQKVIHRHDTLRTAVLWESLSRPVQVVYRQATLSVEELKLDPDRDPIEQLREWMRPGRRGLNLRQAPLMRLLVAADARGAPWYAVLQVHHLVCDHQSLRVVVGEALACLEGREQALPSPVPFRNHVMQALASADTEDAEAFFRSQLGEVDEPTAPFGLLEVHGDGHQIEEHREALDETLAKAVRTQAQRLGVSAARLFHAAWGLVVVCASGRSDVVFGTVLLAGRQRRASAQRMLGMSVNTLPLRLRLQDLTAQEFVEHTHRELVEVLRYEQASLALAQRCSGLAGTAPLFTALLNFRHSVPDSLDEHGAGASIRVLERGEAWSNYPVAMTVDDLGQGFVLTAQTDRRIEARRVTTYLHTAVQSLVNALEEAPWRPALSLSILPESERLRVIEQFNATRADYPREKLIHELFEEQVERRSDAVAAVQGDQSLTYAELNAQANQLARYLISQGVAPGDYIPVLMARSLAMLIAQLAVLKSGAVYVPVDPELPAERRIFIIRDCGARRILSDVEQPPDLRIEIEQWIDLAKVTTVVESFSGKNVPLQRDTVPGAYVMYTSGSTGVPKGVVVPHPAVNRLAINNGYAQIVPDDCIAHYSNPAFDASTFEIWGALLNGARIVIVPQSVVLEAARFGEVLERERVTVLWMSVGLFNQSTQTLARAFSRLRYLIVGGDSLEPGAIRRVLQNSPPQQLLNAYGPTECTTFSTTYRIEAVEPGAKSIPIGRPIANAQIYILDRRRQPVPVGVAGEIYIGGAGVAYGYLNRPEQTAERFLADPFSVDPRARMYRTGDLAKWRTDGAIEFLGRDDHQVKIRGFRIELGEIEAQLARHAQVKEAVVIACQDVPREKRLVAYVTVRDQPGPSVEELRAHLKALIPEYMIPSAFVMLEGMPLTSNGKLDRRALPVPDIGAYASRQYEAPKGDVEEILAGIWQALLHVQRVGRQDNFFELGGHSLLMVQMMERLRRVGLSIEVRCVFENPTLADLAGALTRDAVRHVEVPPNLIPPGCQAITPQMLTLVELEAEHIERIVRSVPGGAVNVQDIYPLAPLQEGILFHHLLDETRGDTYVLPIVLTVASRQRVDELVAALQAVIDRHDVLRTAVCWEQLPTSVQVVHRRAILPVTEITLDPILDATDQISEWLKPERQRIDIRHAPPMRLQVTADPLNGQWYVLLQLHHITIDHMTWEMLTSEVVAHLNGQAQGLPSTAAYRDHVAQTLAYARTHDVEAFFRSKLEEVYEPTAPFGLLEVHGDGAHIEEAHEQLESTLAQRIRTQARSLGVTAATLFHAAWGLVVASTSGRDDVVFASVLLGRLQGSAGAQGALGMFINTLPLRLQLRGVTVRELVEQTQRELVELLSHEQASLAVAQRCSGIEGSAPLFTTLLNYRHSVANPAAEWASAAGIRMLAIQDRTNYPITLSVDDLGEGFALTAQTDRRIDPNRVNGLLHTAMQSLVDALEGTPTRPALGLSILPEKERHQVIERFNATHSDYPQEKLIHELFESQVHRTPDAVAVMHEGQSITYAELNGKANQLARYLRGKGIGPDGLVGICVERSLEMVIGLLGILKAGGAYVPLDPNYPLERLHHMLEDAAPQVVLTQKKLNAVLPSTKAARVALDETLNELTGDATENLARPALGITAQNLVYVIYTSGSTGRPKGTAMRHRSMVNLIEWHRQNLPSREGQRVLQFAALSFDVAFQEIFSTLCTGGTLMLLDEWVRKDARALLELLSDQSIDRLFVPPIMLQALSEGFTSTDSIPRGLKDVITAGEQLRISREVVNFFKHLDGCRLHNHYGPTETHVVTALTLAGDPEGWPALPTIGQPISNTQIYVLDGQRRPLPLGVSGELYIGGANVARGYLNQPELTAGRFILDPFSTDPRARLYNTGDLGRWRADGTIEYLGRGDDQVKIRGYRVELGEIEAQLARHAQVRESAVVVREDVPGEKRLVAYVTHREGGGLDPQELRAHLEGLVPEHMLPSAFVILESLPLTPSGKLNRRALPAPELEAYASQEYEAPEGEIEGAIARIWQELLHVEQVGRHDSFFDLGGHSLLAVKVLFKLNESFGSALRVTDIYTSPTLRELATRISGSAFEDDLVDLSREATLDSAIAANPGVLCVPAKAVLLTGGTGFVGRFLLVQLLQDTDAVIYCLVRASSQDQASFRLRTTLAKWDLWRDAFEPRIVAIPGDLRQPRLGVDEVTYQLLSREIDSIYHCGTSMNHLETYAMAKPANVESARELLRLATNHKPKLINYISTMSVFRPSATDASRVVEETSPIDHESHRSSSGYAASKWIGEKIFMTASERGIPCNIFRVGFVWADTQQGRYDELQRGYRILKSCLLSGYGIRNFRYHSPPTPVDYAARAMVFLANRHSDGRGIFHISSSREMMIEGVFERCNEFSDTSLELVPYYDWVCQIKRLHHEGQSLPIVPLIEVAFSLDEKSLYEHELRMQSANVPFDCGRTHRELERAGIVAPVFNDDLLRMSVESMLSRDADFRDWMDDTNGPRLTGRKEGDLTPIGRRSLQSRMQ